MVRFDLTKSALFHLNLFKWTRTAPSDIPKLLANFLLVMLLRLSKRKRNFLPSQTLIPRRNPAPSNISKALTYSWGKYSLSNISLRQATVNSCAFNPPLFPSLSWERCNFLPDLRILILRDKVEDDSIFLTGELAPMGTAPSVTSTTR